MIAVMDLPETATPAERQGVQRPILCPDCGRYLTTHVAPLDLPPRTVWARINCRTCARWSWFDVATGRRKDGDDLTERRPS